MLKLLDDCKKPRMTLSARLRGVSLTLSRNKDSGEPPLSLKVDDISAERISFGPSHSSLRADVRGLSVDVGEHSCIYLSESAVHFLNYTTSLCPRVAGGEDNSEKEVGTKEIVADQLSVNVEYADILSLGRLKSSLLGDSDTASSRKSGSESDKGEKEGGMKDDKSSGGKKGQEVLVRSSALSLNLNTMSVQIDLSGLPSKVDSSSADEQDCCKYTVEGEGLVLKKEVTVDEQSVPHSSITLRKSKLGIQYGELSSS
uniref:Uncharacterized protein n=1 Tax=Palpitomonas bilix TaxID=652834 RepID=A0A7S3G7Y1_9EUKA|mmetsp:Transcript_26803/g.68901  ORF Transcript_26803/g.68901 Transcript_26803/m.68901 type:complete len:257 (+) Transcript_26803:3-773(+)